MNIKVTGLEREVFQAYLEEHFAGKFSFVEENPEMVFCYGGDGTLLYSEREYPGVPKVMVKNSQTCNLCPNIEKDQIIEHVLAGNYTIVEHKKLSAKVGETVLAALNDVVIAHPSVNGAIRMRVKIDGKQYGHDELVGDGVIFSTPIGSTGYYQTITRSNFDKGIGVAFNNMIHLISHVVIEETSKIEVEVVRGPGFLAVDNDTGGVELETGDVVEVFCAKETAKLVHFAEEDEEFTIKGRFRVPLAF